MALPAALLRCPLHRGEQSQQALSVFGAGVFLQCLAERQVLCLALRRQARRIGRDEGERCFFVLPVLGEIEMDASDQIPGRVPRLEERLHRQAGLLQLGIERRVDARQRSPSTAGVRYSAPSMGGTAAATPLKSASPGGGTAGLCLPSAIPGSEHRAGTEPGPKARPKEKN